MTTATDDLRLAADFPEANEADWRKLVDGVLKGAPFEKLVGKTSDGLRIDPIYRRAADTADSVDNDRAIVRENVRRRTEQRHAEVVRAYSTITAAKSDKPA